MSIYPQDQTQNNFALFTFGAIITVVTATMVAPLLGLLVALPWAFIILWVTSIRDIFMPEDLTEEQKLTREQMKWFHKVGSERRFWKVFDKERRRKDEKHGELLNEIAKLKTELDELKQPKEEEGPALVVPTADRGPSPKSLPEDKGEYTNDPLAPAPGED